MPTITFISHDGQSYKVHATTGMTLMETAVDFSVPGVVAECGGACSCGTCHVYVDPNWYAQLPAPDDSEQALLEFAVDPRDNSRLSCQIEITEDLDGLVVRTPESQY